MHRYLEKLYEIAMLASMVLLFMALVSGKYLFVYLLVGTVIYTITYYVYSIVRGFHQALTPVIDKIIPENEKKKNSSATYPFTEKDAATLNQRLQNEPTGIGADGEIIWHNEQQTSQQTGEQS